MNPVEFKPDTL